MQGGGAPCLYKGKVGGKMVFMKVLVCTVITSTPIPFIAAPPPSPVPTVLYCSSTPIPCTHCPLLQLHPHPLYPLSFIAAPPPSPVPTVLYCSSTPIPCTHCPLLQLHPHPLYPLSFIAAPPPSSSTKTTLLTWQPCFQRVSS